MAYAKFICSESIRASDQSTSEESMEDFILLLFKERQFHLTQGLPVSMPML
jgi:hypothetical protein